MRPAIIFELTGISTIPLLLYNHDKKMAEKVEEVTEKIEKYLMQGFYFALNFDLTTNA